MTKSLSLKPPYDPLRKSFENRLIITPALAGKHVVDVFPQVLKNQQYPILL